MIRFLVLLVTLSLAAPSFATTFVMMRDEHLAEDSRLIAVARVVAVDEQDAATRYTIDIERLLQGSLHERSIVMTVVGGRSLWVAGAPRFFSGERTLLFLDANGDGTWSPLHLMLGTFREEGRLATRDLGGARELTAGGSASDARRERDFARFADWLADRAAGRARLADYWIDAPLRLAPKYTFFLSADPHLRRFAFQWGKPIEWYVDEHADMARAAAKAWNEVPGTLIRNEIAGKGAGTAALLAADGRNSILFSDPHDSARGRYQCGRGGVIAKTGAWFDVWERIHYRDGEAIPIREADIILNDGSDCLFSMEQPERHVAEILGHEFGHSLGFGHSCGALTCPDVTENDALMRSAVHLDGRGARLNSDDITVARILYTPSGPVLGWTADSATVQPNKPLRFTPTAKPAGVSYQWDFGDGSTSTEESPSHAYAKSGTYTVRLRATDSSGTNEITGTIVVRDAKRRAVRRL
ncbi:MAG TPA: PKD domain-containing protein [Thermoanaerobaculia bacterium]|nr:PKD domain-containing protein [Thermoanaerobaculia bacterium]